jgi:hypothetical protein
MSYQLNFYRIKLSPMFVLLQCTKNSGICFEELINEFFSIKCSADEILRNAYRINPTNQRNYTEKF